MIAVNKYMLYNMIFLPLLHPPFCHYIIKKAPFPATFAPFFAASRALFGASLPFSGHPTTFSPPFYACQRRIPPSQSPDCVGLTASRARVPYYIYHHLPSSDDIQSILYILILPTAKRRRMMSRMRRRRVRWRRTALISQSDSRRRRRRGPRRGWQGCRGRRRGVSHRGPGGGSRS